MYHNSDPKPPPKEKKVPQPLRRSPLNRNRNYKIPKVSDTEKKRQAKFRPMRKKYMAENEICEYPLCELPSQELHHKFGKVGNDLFRGFCALCYEHHRWAELNPIQAKQIGLSKSRLNKRD